MIAMIAAANLSGDPRPLANLAGREAAIVTHALARSQLRSSPDRNLLSAQLKGAAGSIVGISHLQMRKG